MVRFGLAPAQGVLRIRNAYWSSGALVLLLGGFLVALLGLLRSLAFQIDVSHPTDFIALGLAMASVGGWIVYRPGETVFDPIKAMIRVRSPIRERGIRFSDVFHIEIQPTVLPLAMAGQAPFSLDLFDIVLCLRDGTDVATYVGLNPSRARSAAELLADTIGVSVFIGGAG